MQHFLYFLPLPHGHKSFLPIFSPMGKMFFNILATFAEFEADLIRLRTREGMAIACAKGKLRGKQPSLSDKQQKELRRMYDSGDHSISNLAEVFSVSRPTIYRTLTVPNSDQKQCHLAIKATGFQGLALCKRYLLVLPHPGLRVTLSSRPAPECRRPSD